MVISRIAAVTIILWACVSCTSLSGNPDGEFDWLIGRWVTGDGAITEQWWAVSEKTFEGMGTTTSGDKVSTELMRLLFMGDETFFVAKVAHNEVPVAFRLLPESTPGHSVFANPKHDFPKQIVYDRDGADQMTVTVSDGGEKGFQLRFFRRPTP